MQVVDLLRRLRELGGSDLHLAAGRPVKVRLHGQLERLTDRVVEPHEVGPMLQAITSPETWRHFERTHDADFAFESPETGRFRVNLLMDRQGPAAVFRQIPERVLSIEDLVEKGLPEIVARFATFRSGLVLVTGPTGSGKSTTLAAIVDRINRTRPAHIVTIEEPIEFVHQSRMALVTQREVGLHTKSFQAALRSAIREDPDVLLVGELRDLETMRLALTAAETGLLVFGTLHTNSAPRAIDRIIDMFPAPEQPQARSVLAATLQAVLAQILVRKAGGGRVAAVEILQRNVALQRLIRQGETHMIAGAFRRGNGDRSMDEALVSLWRAGWIDTDEARQKLHNKKLLALLGEGRGEVGPGPQTG